MAKVFSVNVSRGKGTSKTPVDAIELVPDLGVRGDAHAAPGIRQVSLLAIEDIRRARSEAAESCSGKIELGPGSYAENVTTEGIDLTGLPVGTELKVGSEARIRISKIGKDCHGKCAIYYKIGDCVMPSRGVFAEVVAGGEIKAGDSIETG